MFSTPVGGAALLGVIFTLILLRLMVLFIVEGIKDFFKDDPVLIRAKIDEYLNDKEKWLNGNGEKPQTSLIFKNWEYMTFEQASRNKELEKRLNSTFSVS